MTLNTKKFATYSQPEITSKSAVVLHFTAGSSVGGAVSWWRANYESKKWALGTPYLVDRDGTVYQVFDPQKWAYHLAAGIAQEKRTIGIEFVNWGPLRLENGVYTPLNFRSVAIDRADVDEAQYRGQRFWQRFPEAQVKAGNELVKTLCQRFSIQRVIPAPEWRGNFEPTKAAAFRGVLSHENFRNDKVDIGPLWDWARTQQEIA